MVELCSFLHKDSYFLESFCCC